MVGTLVVDNEEEEEDEEPEKEGRNECCTGMNSTPNSEIWHLIVESFKLLLLLLLLQEAPDLESRLENESIVSETATTKQRNVLKIENKQVRRRISRNRNRNVFCDMHGDYAEERSRRKEN